MFQYPRCWIVSSDAIGVGHNPDSIPSFSILAVGSFPQTTLAEIKVRTTELSVSSLLDRFLRRVLPCGNTGAQNFLSVSSLLDRFLRRRGHGCPRRSAIAFQYPRCWIVSSDPGKSVQHCRRSDFQYPRCWIVSSDWPWGGVGDGVNVLSVSSLLDRFLRPSTPHGFLPCGGNFQYPRCWIVSSDR